MFPRLLFAVRWPLIAIGLIATAVSASAQPQAGWSFDTGTDAATAAATLPGPAPAGSWLRIRGLAVPSGADAAAGIRQSRESLARLRQSGYHLVVHLRWPTDSWPGGARTAAANRLPIDLREPFARCRELARTYGDLVDYWEIENEPDISFVQENPETYAAYLKACYAGIARGNVERAKAEKRNTTSAAGGSPPGSSVSSVPTSQFSTFPGRAASRVLMAPLALPPGPYFEAFIANGGLTYTDGFNYHFYGYAEDFSGVYHQFEAAVAAASKAFQQEVTKDTKVQSTSQEEAEKAEKGRERDVRPGTKLESNRTEPTRTEASRTDQASAFRVSPSAFPTTTPSVPQSLRPPTQDEAEAAEKGARDQRPDAKLESNRTEPTRTEASRTERDSAFRVSPSGFPAVFHTQFFPNAAGWRATILERFDEPAEQGEANRQLLLNRPLAHEEPVLHRQGRWLVSDGVTVEETGGVWRFTVTRWPAGPYRAPTAELPLGNAAGPKAETLTTDTLTSLPPAGGTPATDSISASQHVSVSAFPSDSLLTFEYRLVEVLGATSVKAEDALSAEQQHVDPKRTGFNRAVLQEATENQSALRSPQSLQEEAERAEGDRSSAFRVAPSAFPERQLPVFLTEYAYGSLDKVTRDTADGRERQRAFFAQVDQQIRDLGIEGAMAFVLMPYLERDIQEFGLLSRDPVPSAQGEDPETGIRHGGPETGNLKLESSLLQVSGLKAQVSTSASQRIGEYYVSPALAEILRHGNTPVTPKRWAVATPRRSPVVIDFIGGYGLGQSKSYGGYFLERAAGLTLPGHGNLVVYNFSDKDITGELTLTGDSWRFPDRDIKPETRNLKPESSPTRVPGLKSQVSSSLYLRLKPGARILVPVRVWTQVDHFVACPAGAEFREAAIPPGTKPFEPVSAFQNVSVSPSPGSASQGASVSAVLPQAFAPYIRTANGNLYGTWPRLPVTGTWQLYMHRAEDFTMFFWGRANLPWRLEENRPVALVFSFYPSHFPAVYEFRGARMETFEKPKR